MSIRRITQSVVNSAPLRGSAYRIHDKNLKGFNAQIMPSGRKAYYVVACHNGYQINCKIGDASRMLCDEAREIARRLLADHKNGLSAPDTAFEVIAEAAFRQHERLWKPNTMRVNRDYLTYYLLPYFNGMEIGGITRDAVEDWFKSLAHIPTTANRASSVLSVILKVAESLGCREDGENHVRGLRRYKRKTKERVLTQEEMARLGDVLRKRKSDYPMQVAMILLIVLTGCRKSEITTLQWRDYRGGHLHLRDSKTGPKTVFLSSPARAVLDGLKTRRSKWVFPSKGSGYFTMIDYFWRDVRKEAGLEDVRLHDLRHNYASVAIRSGESLRVIGALLGHEQAETTLRYAHLDDSTMHNAVQEITTSMMTRREAAE